MICPGQTWSARPRVPDIERMTITPSGEGAPSTVVRPVAATNLRMGVSDASIRSPSTGARWLIA